MNEPITVETRRDEEGRLVPITFTWREGHCVLADWGRRWSEDGVEHMLVRTGGGETFELAFDERDGSWRLLRELHTKSRGADLA